MGMSQSEVLELSVTIDLMTSARALGISRNEAYALARAGKYPVQTYKIGNRYRVIRADLLNFLHIPTEPETPALAGTPEFDAA